MDELVKVEAAMLVLCLEYSKPETGEPAVGSACLAEPREGQLVSGGTVNDS